MKIEIHVKVNNFCDFEVLTSHDSQNTDVLINPVPTVHGMVYFVQGTNILNQTYNATRKWLVFVVEDNIF